MEIHRSDLVAVGIVVLEELVHSQVPQVNGSISRSSSDAVPIWMKGNSSYAIGVVEERVCGLSIRKVPNMDHFVIATRGTESPIRTEIHATNPIGVPR